MTLAGFDITNEQVINEGQEVTQKLPFDINDYLNFELNEDFISPSAVFINDYSQERKHSDAETDENDEEENEETMYDSDLEKAVDVVALDRDMNDSDSQSDKADVFSFKRNYTFSNENNSILSCYTPSYLFQNSSTESLDIEEESKKFFREKQRKNLVSSLDPNDNHFNILDIHHEDFQCSVMNKDRTQCEDSILCPLHPYREKYIVPRSEDLDKLIRNYKYLKHLNEKIINESDISSESHYTRIIQPFNITMERHNSYQENLTMITHDSKGNLLQQKVSFDSIFGVPSNRLSPDVFIEALSLKLSDVDEDPENRLLEFHYRNDLKNFAISKLYNEHDFEMNA